MAKLLTLLFSPFFVKTCFFQKSHSPCIKKKIFEKPKKDNKKEMAKLLTYDGQVIALQHIYIYAGELLVCPPFGLLESY